MRAEPAIAPEPARPAVAPHPRTEGTGLVRAVFPPTPVQVGARRLPVVPTDVRDLRRAQSRVVRELAAAMSGHDFAAESIGSHASGQPTWPRGWIGSLAHANEWCVAAVGQDAAGLALGIDVDAPARLGRDAWTNVFTPDEQRRLHALPTGEQPRTAALMFSAKEATYKALYPMCGDALGFFDCAVTLSPEGAWTLELQRAVPHAPGVISGRWTVLDSHVVALCAIVRPGA